MTDLNPPDWLGRQAKFYFRKFAASLKDPKQAELLALACDQLETYRQCREEIEKGEPLQQGKSHPLFKVQQEALSQFLVITKRLGLFETAEQSEANSHDALLKRLRG